MITDLIYVIIAMILGASICNVRRLGKVRKALDELKPDDPQWEGKMHEIRRFNYPI